MAAEGNLSGNESDTTVILDYGNGSGATVPSLSSPNPGEKVSAALSVHDFDSSLEFGSDAEQVEPTFSLVLLQTLSIYIRVSDTTQP